MLCQYTPALFSLVDTATNASQLKPFPCLRAVLSDVREVDKLTARRTHTGWTVLKDFCFWVLAGHSSCHSS